MNLLHDNPLPNVSKRVEFCYIKQRSSGLFRICNPIISLRHFYSIFVWICIEICGFIIWLVVRKNTQYQALSAFCGEIRSYEIGTFALNTKFHIYLFSFKSLYFSRVFTLWRFGSTPFLRHFTLFKSLYHKTYYFSISIQYFLYISKLNCIYSIE